MAVPVPDPQSSYSLPSAPAPAPPPGRYGPPRPATVTCPGDQVKSADGNCVTPMISRNIFVFAAPKMKMPEMEKPKVPMPKLNYNIVFVRTPEMPGDVDPLVVPPPQEKTLVYVLNRRPEAPKQDVIEMPMNLNRPEVFYVNYEDGQNLDLPGGANIDLQTALQSSAAQDARLLEAEGSSAPSGGYGAPPPPPPPPPPSVPTSSYGTPFF